jgi:uncharacterized membrane protein YfcA
MEITLPLGELAWMTLALLAGGVVAGFLAGLFGIGGGGILVPILFEVFNLIGVPIEVRMHLAVGTSLAIIIPTSIRSFKSHHARGAVDMSVLRDTGPAVGVGVIIGVFIAALVDATVLKAVFLVSATLMATNMFVGRGQIVLGAQLPGRIANWAVGLVIGVVCTLIGIGGGAYLVTYMTLYGRSIHQSIATGAGLGPIIAIPATIGFVVSGLGAEGLPPGSLGYVSLIGALIIIPASVLVAPLGVRVAHGLSERKLELAFGVFLSFVALRFLTSLIFE